MADTAETEVGRKIFNGRHLFASLLPNLTNFTGFSWHPTTFKAISTLSLSEVYAKVSSPTLRVRFSFSGTPKRTTFDWRVLRSRFIKYFVVFWQVSSRQLILLAKIS